MVRVPTQNSSYFRDKFELSPRPRMAWSIVNWVPWQEAGLQETVHRLYRITIHHHILFLNPFNYLHEQKHCVLIHDCTVPFTGTMLNCSSTSSITKTCYILSNMSPPWLKFSGFLIIRVRTQDPVCLVIINKINNPTCGVTVRVLRSDGSFETLLHITKCNIILPSVYPGHAIRIHIKY